jgi:alpha-methylacyl-CoA racemase
MAIAGMLGVEHPQVPRLQWGDFAAGGLAAALRIAGALVSRQASGEGDWLDIAMLDGLVGLQQTQFAQLAAGAPPDTLLTGGAPQYGIYRCSDGGWITVAALEPHFYAELAAAADVSEEGLTRLFASAPRDAWLTRLGGACVAPVLALDEVARDPQVAARGLFAGGLVHPPTGPVAGTVPALGEHTDEELARVGRPVRAR